MAIKRSNSFNKKNLRPIRHELRRKSTVPECVLWRTLKNKQIDNLKFRRQYSVEHSIFDFYCPEIKLAIELDGDNHYFQEGEEKDRRRDEFFARNFGITTLRFENWQVYDELDVIIKSIRDYKNKYLSTNSHELVPLS